MGPVRAPVRRARLNEQLQEVLRRLHARPLNVSATEPVFEPDARDEDQEPSAERVRQDYELDKPDWEAIACAPTWGDNLPMRFIDSSFRAQLVACIEDAKGYQRPLILASMGAAALDLVPDTPGRPYILTRALDKVGAQLVLLAKGLNPRDLETLHRAMRTINIELIAPEHETITGAFEAMRLRTVEQVRQAMLRLETELLRREPDVPTVIDGLLDHRLETFSSHNLPAVGVVKRQMQSYLHPAGRRLIYALRPGQRTPAVLVDTTRGQFVTFYLRLAAREGTVPDAGIVRVIVSKEYFEDSVGMDFRYLTGLADWLCRLRCRNQSYARALVSLDPIVHAEDHLRAILPDLDEWVAKFVHFTGLHIRIATRSA